MRVRKKTQTVEAWQLTEDTKHSIISILDAGRADFMPFGHGIVLNTADGTLLVSPRDYIIRGTQGNFYSCKPDVFASAYEILTEWKEEEYDQA